MTDYDVAWKKLRRKVRAQHKAYDGAGTSKDSRALAAALTAAYGSVLRMMDTLEARP